MAHEVLLERRINVEIEFRNGFKVFENSKSVQNSLGYKQNASVYFAGLLDLPNRISGSARFAKDNFGSQEPKLLQGKLLNLRDSLGNATPFLVISERSYSV